MRLPQMYLPEVYVETIMEWLQTDWLSDSDRNLLNQIIQQNSYTEKDELEIQRISREETKQYFNNRPLEQTHIITTLWEDEMMTEFIRWIAIWVKRKGENRLTEIKTKGGLNLEGKEEIMEFRNKLCFIRDFMQYNTKWKGILEDLQDWFEEEYIIRNGRVHRIKSYQYETESDMKWNKEHIQQSFWKDSPILDELINDCW